MLGSLWVMLVKQDTFWALFYLPSAPCDNLFLKMCALLSYKALQCKTIKIKVNFQAFFDLKEDFRFEKHQTKSHPPRMTCITGDLRGGYVPKISREFQNRERQWSSVNTFLNQIMSIYLNRELARESTANTKFWYQIINRK